MTQLWPNVCNDAGKMLAKCLQLSKVSTLIQHGRYPADQKVTVCIFLTFLNLILSKTTKNFISNLICEISSSNKKWTDQHKRYLETCEKMIHVQFFDFFDFLVGFSNKFQVQLVISHVSFHFWYVKISGGKKSRTNRNSRPSKKNN